MLGGSSSSVVTVAVAVAVAVVAVERPLIWGKLWQVSDDLKPDRNDKNER